MRNSCHIICSLCFLCFTAVSCGNRNDAAGPVYSSTPPPSVDTEYAIHIQGLMNVSAMMDVFEPMATYLEDQMPGKKFKIEVVYNFDQFRNFTLKQNPALIVANPVEAMNAMDSGYEVIASLGDKNFARAVLLVPDNSTINSIADLKRKNVVFPPPSAFIGTVVPEYALNQYSRELYQSINIRYLSSIESPVYALLENKADAAFLTNFSWHRFQRYDPLSAKRLRVVYQTDSIAAPAVLMNARMDSKDARQIMRLLISFNATPGGKKLKDAFGGTAFFPADNDQYKTLKPFIRSFEKEIRPLYKNQ